MTPEEKAEAARLDQHLQARHGVLWTRHEAKQRTLESLRELHEVHKSLSGDCGYREPKR